MARRAIKAVRQRVRRDPEAARELIIAAAEHVFADQSPDVVGLKDVARVADVSHALVSHYFGTYDRLVDAVLERRAAMTRAGIFAELLDGDVEIRPGALLDRLWASAGDPTTIRLSAWAMLNGRLDRSDFYAARVQGLRLVADALSKRLRTRKGERLARADLEFLLMSALTLVHGYAIGRAALQASLGHDVSPAADADFRARVGELLERHFDLPRRRGRD
jgi:AcrR family transcriptional regulator